MRLIPWSLAWLFGLSRLAPSSARAAPRAPPARADQIVITGTGRAGTTFLMALFTQLRLPTGFTPRDFANCTDVYACPHAGYEWGELTADALPALRAKGVEIVKSPHLAAPKEARRWLAGAGVAHVIVPLRDLANVSRSRVAHGHDNGGLPADVADGATLQHVNERVLAHLLVLIVQRDTPSTLLAFPRRRRRLGASGWPYFISARRLVAISDLSFEDGVKAVFSSAVSGRRGPSPWPNMVLHTALHHGGRFCTPPCGGAGNVRAGTEPGARFGRADSPGAPTGWAIPPDPQQPRGGEIPVQGGP